MKNEELVTWSVLACLHVLHYKSSLKNDSKIQNSELLKVFEIDLTWTMFKSELQTIANCLKNQIEIAKDKLSNHTTNRLNCQVLPKLLDIQHDICSFVVRMLKNN